MNMRFGCLLTISLFLVSVLQAKGNYSSDYELPREIASEEESNTPTNIKIYSNVDLNITRISGVNDVGFGLTAGTDVVWHFSPAVGLFAGLDYSQIKGEESGDEVSVDYIDLPFGMAFGVASSRIGYSTATHIVNLGLYYGIPMTDLKVGATKIDAENMLGLNFETHSDFKITDEFYLGFHIQVKYGFRDIIADNKNPFGSSSKPLTTALGLSARFL